MELPIEQAAERLRGGGVLAVGTESSFALCASIASNDAIAEVLRLKQQRTAPMGLMAADTEQAFALWHHPEDIPVPLEQVWPAAASFVYHGRSNLPDAVTGPEQSVSVRVPALAQLRRLCGLAGPLTATSANRTGQAPLYEPALLGTLGTELDWCIVPAGAKQPSTLVDLRTAPPTVLRQGAWPVPADWGCAA